ncbi:MAG: trypsin-like peptidase domain-containing protein [Rhodoferax sp.]|nr:trypsin-like peptidase domain-containing protein [Rhodoferax sp.]MCW5627489.1 trypsin-like peptidase domain-containing protein [Rhodoferax sp.]
MLKPLASLRRAAVTLRVLAVVLLALAGAGMPPPAAAQKDGTPRTVSPRGELGAEERATIELFEQARDSVVFISTRSRVRDIWSRNVFTVPRGNGSGFIWDESGHVVTNLHVIEGASEASVKLADGRDYRASLVGASPAHDIAVLRINVPNKRPTPVPLGSSHDLKVGQKVFAIGNPFGLDWTLTSGIVSALNRSINADGGVAIENLVQTDAAVNPGNSGGPLLDSAGRLIGITTAIYSPSGASAGIGFAVPVDTVNRVVPQIIRHGRYIRPTLGIRTDEELNRRLCELLKVRGVVVLRPAPGKPLAGGLRETTVGRDGAIALGDVIVAVEGKPIESVAQLLARLDDFKPGDTVGVTVMRQGRAATLPLTLGTDG